MKTITVLSGKGGVGKSSVTACLALLLKDKDLVVADCDVDAPNLGLILGVEEFESEKGISTNEKAFLDEEKCTGCKKCENICTFSAIKWDKEKNKPEINKYLCGGCGACGLVCPEGAFELKKVQNATIMEGKTKYGFPIISGQLKMGESGSGKIVNEIKERAEEKKKELLLVDSAAGIGCPVIASIRDSDFVVGVTEPSPSGLSDLKRALKIVEHFKVDYGIVINKWDLNKEFSKKIENFLKDENIPLLGKLLYDKAFVDSIVNLKPLVEYDKSFKGKFKKILNKIPIK